MPTESKKLSPTSTSNSKPGPQPALTRDQLKVLPIDFMDQLAASKPPAAKQGAEMRDLLQPDADATSIQITDESDRSTPDRSEESALADEPRSSQTTTEPQPDASTTPKSPIWKEVTLHGVKFVNGSNPCPSSELLPNWSPKRRS
jgi:hypothetical protein